MATPGDDPDDLGRELTFERRGDVPPTRRYDRRELARRPDPPPTRRLDRRELAMEGQTVVPRRLEPEPTPTRRHTRPVPSRRGLSPRRFAVSVGVLALVTAGAIAVGGLLRRWSEPARGTVAPAATVQPQTQPDQAGE